MSLSLSEFKVLQHLGSGTYGNCKKVCRKRNRSQVFAWKEVHYGQFSDTELRMLCQEVNLLRTLQHQHVVAYEGRIVDTNSQTIFILMEFCELGDLGKLITGFARVNRLLPLHLVPEPFVWRVVTQLLEALHYCHSANNGPIVHRDIKPANVLIDSDWNLKLADFGLSRVLSSMQSLATTFVGSPMYMSPELVADGYSHPKSDIWALGCVLHELMALRAPFSADSEPELRDKIAGGQCSQLPLSYSAELRTLVRQLLTVDIHSRPSAADVLSQSIVRQQAASTGAVSWQQVLEEMMQGQTAGQGHTAGGMVIDQSEAAKLLQLQRQLAEQEAELLQQKQQLEVRQLQLADDEAKAHQLQERLDGREQELRKWETNLAALGRSLAEKQKIITETELQLQQKRTSRQQQQQQHRHSEAQRRKTSSSSNSEASTATATAIATAATTATTATTAAAAVRRQRRQPLAPRPLNLSPIVLTPTDSAAAAAAAASDKGQVKQQQALGSYWQPPPLQQQQQQQKVKQQLTPTNLNLTPTAAATAAAAAAAAAAAGAELTGSYEPRLCVRQQIVMRQHNA